MPTSTNLPLGKSSWPLSLPVLRLSALAFHELYEYSCSVPTGTTIGKRWKRLDGAHDQGFIRRGGIPQWVIGEYAENVDPTKVTINWYRPIICLRAAT